MPEYRVKIERTISQVGHLDFEASDDVDAQQKFRDEYQLAGWDEEYVQWQSEWYAPSGPNLDVCSYDIGRIERVDDPEGD